MAEYIQFKCKCGRNLRVKVEQSGATIKCWSCQTEQVVPRVATGGLLARLWFLSLGRVFSAESIFLTLLAAVIVSAALPIPWAGPFLGLALLAVVVSRYRTILGQSGLLGAPDVSSQSRHRVLAWIMRWSWNLAAALILIAPFLLRYGVMDGLDRMLGFDVWGIAFMAALCWLIFPLAMVATSARDPSGPLSAGEAVGALRWHPLASILALLVLPFGLVMLELAFALITWQQMWLGTFLGDLFPALDNDHFVVSFPRPLPIEFGMVSDMAHAKCYAHGLRYGYTLLGSIPASVPLGTAARFRPHATFPIGPYHYLGVRVLFSALILTGAGLLLQIQARWLGLIASVDSRRAGAGAGTTQAT
jgi:hypothetical protein